VEWRRAEYEISTDRARLDRRAIWQFLRTSYWWHDDAPLESVEKAIDNSPLVFGLYDSAGQAGFARVVTDRSRFGWLADVFVLEPHRGRGLGVWLVETVLEHPELRGIRMVLGTADAHGLYERFGFRPVDQARMMERPAR
jgi:GNAT superfamily N-acetyltransferase